jgi:hypothetical protein
MSDNDCKNYLPCKHQTLCKKENYIKWRDCQIVDIGNQNDKQN